MNLIHAEIRKYLEHFMNPSRLNVEEILGRQITRWMFIAKPDNGVNGLIN